MRPAVLLIGCGRMGSAFLRGWRNSFDVYVLDPSAPTPEGAVHLESPSDIAKLPETLEIMLAVKPGVLSSLLPQIKPHVSSNQLFVSIIAGASVDCLRAGLGSEARVVRAMPNIAVEAGAGMSAAVAGPSVGADERQRCELLMGSTGDLVWLDDESQMDAATAVSGSGPAYFFQFAEHLAQAGIAQGLEPDLAMRLARATLIGAGALSKDSPETLSTLRERVTSPGGTTAAALDRLNAGGGLSTIVTDAVNAAAQRSQELNQLVEHQISGEEQ